jgi:hypothetical protein
MDVILLHSGHHHVSATHGGENKNIYITKIYLNNSTVLKIMNFSVKIEGCIIK